MFDSKKYQAEPDTVYCVEVAVSGGYSDYFETVCATTNRDIMKQALMDNREAYLATYVNGKLISRKKQKS